MIADLRSAVRQLCKSPGFSAVVILTLAFGVAVNITIFGMVRVFLLRRMPVPEADRLVLVMQSDDAFKMPHGLSFPDFKDYRERARQVRDLIAYVPNPVHLSPEGRAPERAWIEVVTPNAFQALAVPAAVGRTLLPSDGEARGAAPVTVLSYDCWQNRFGADPAIVGRAILLNGRPFTVVGVARRGFQAFSVMFAVSAIVPTGALDSLRENGGGLLEWRNAAGSWRSMGKLSPGATLAAARAEAAVIMQQLVREYPDAHHNTRAVVIPESHARPDPAFADFLVIFTALFVGLVGLVLFIACANVANLLFARAAARQRELTLRAALGASRGRLVRQMLVESLPLAVLAGAGAWLIADWVGELLARFAPRGDLPVNLDLGPVWPNIVFTAVISLVAALASGLLPAIRASRIDLVDDLKEGAGGRATSGRHWMRNLFVLSQVTFSAVVLICAGFFLRSLHQMRTLDLGFRPDHLLLASFDLGLQGYNRERGEVFCRQLLERVGPLPGVRQASLTSHVAFDYLGMSGRDIWPENPPPRMKEGNTSAGLAQVEPGFFALLGLRLRTGRTLAATDVARSPRVAVVNQALVDVCWPGQEAVGKRFRPWKDGPWIEVVGVADTAKYLMLTEPARPFFYEPLAQDYVAPLTLVIRTNGDPAAMAHTVREAFRGLDPHLPLYGERTMEELMETSPLAYLPMRMGVTLAGVQGMIGLGLAMMGLYAVVSFGVAQRTREIGIRMALGADARAVVRFVVREGVRLTIIGLGMGIALAILLGFGLSRILFGLSAIDPLVLGCVMVLLLATAGLACWLPARRATKVDPIVALRAE
jgi:putative ABC transport system permease protein